MNQSGYLTRIKELEQQLLRLQNQLIQSEKLSTVGVLASSITHEFNNILTTIINYAKMGVRHKDDATRDKALEKILAAGQRAAKITTGMLSYARTSGDHKEAYHLAQLVDDVLILIEKDLQKHRIQLVRQLESNPAVLVNPSQIQQLLLNLMINARQAMSEGGTLTISLTQNDQDSFGEVTVRDTGSGIPPETLPRIFDSFFSTKKADETGQGGSGLGLALCKQIIEAHHGRIRVESAVNQGTAFTIKLPLAKQAGLVSASSFKAG